jgi:hypothetical protein
MINKTKELTVNEVKAMNLKEFTAELTKKTPTKNPTKATTPTKKVKFREIFGIRLGAKPSIELRTAVKVIEKNKERSKMTFNFILSEYKKEMIRNDKKTDGKNFEGRLRRILYRSIESGITRESIQGIKFNLSANYKGIKVETSQPFQFNNSANVARKEVEENLYTFVFEKDYKLVNKASLKTYSAKVKAFKKAIQ